LGGAADLKKAWHWPDIRVNSVLRFQSSELWRKYMLYRAELLDSLKRPEQVVKGPVPLLRLQGQKPLSTDVNECYLFLGAKTGAIDDLLLRGYGNKKPGAAQPVFTDCFYYADNFVPCRDCGMLGCQGCTTEFEIVACRVLLGRPELSQKSLVGGNLVPARSCHSIASLSRLLDPKSANIFSEFVVTTPGAVYPEYLIRYSRVAPAWDYRHATTGIWTPFEGPASKVIEENYKTSGQEAPRIRLEGTALAVDLKASLLYDAVNRTKVPVRRRPRDTGQFTQVANALGETLGRRTLEGRLRSFAAWPHHHDPQWRFATFVQPKVLGRLGFYYTPTRDHDDAVTCAFCGVCVWGWTTDHDPLRVHVEKSPRCPYLDGRPTDNIDVYLGDWKARGTALDKRSAMERALDEAGGGTSICPQCNMHERNCVCRMPPMGIRDQARGCFSRNCFTFD